ncbi:hypothetical protein KBB27_01155, partial [Patescibacteria group bacterium]|nr:hypothetical protein [Patescibacteria group bacterium]
MQLPDNAACWNFGDVLCREGEAPADVPGLLCLAMEPLKNFKMGAVRAFRTDFTAVLRRVW